MSPRKYSRGVTNKILKTFDLFCYLYDKYSYTLGDTISSADKDKYLFNSTQIARELNAIYNSQDDFSKIEHRTVSKHLFEIYNLTHDEKGPKPLMGACLECYEQNMYGEFKKTNLYAIGESESEKRDRESEDNKQRVKRKTIYYALNRVLSTNDYEILKASVYSNQYLDAASQKRIYNALSVMENPRSKSGDGSEFKDVLLDPDASINNKVSLLLQAIQNKVKVQFTYCKYKYEDNSIKLKNNHAGQEENEQRKFSPYFVFSHNGMFYLIAMEDEMDEPIAHHYRVDRIKNLEIVLGKDKKNGFEKRKPMTSELRRYIPMGSDIFDMHEYLTDHPMMFNAYAKDMLTVRLSVTKFLLNVMVDFFADDLDKEHVMEDPSDNNRVIITVYASDMGIKNICKQYGSDTVLLPPTEDASEKDRKGIERLRKELKEEFEKATNCY